MSDPYGVDFEVGTSAEYYADKYRENLATNDKNGLLQSKYNITGLVFPSDLGADSSYNGHMLQINISKSQFSKSSLPGETTLGDFNSGAQTSVTGFSTFRMTDTTILLYMPNTLQFSQANMYEDTSLTNLGASVLSTAFSGKAVKAIAGAAQTLGQLAGIMINPMTEVIFKNTAQRQFQFDFLFAPESEQESQNLKKIIQTLRFHTAPEWGGAGSVEGLYWVEPSQFDITFLNRNVENRNLPKISTCVMENLDVDYAPSGVYSTFTNGYPVSVRVTMKLRERNVLHKEMVKAGY